MLSWDNKYLIKSVILIFAAMMACICVGIVFGYFWLLKIYIIATGVCTGLFILYVAFEEKINPHVREINHDYD